MKTKLICLAACTLAALAFAPAGLAQSAGTQDDPKAAPPARERAARQPEESQQDRMRRCAHEAKEKELKGDERRSFMSACLRH